MSTLRSLRLLGWLMLAGLNFGPAWAADSESQQLMAQERAMQASFDAELRACRDRFFVTGCIEEVNRQRRVALGPIRERLLQIDEGERQRRAAQRLQALGEKAKLKAEREAAAPVADAASQPRRRLLPAAGPRREGEDIAKESAKPRQSAEAAKAAAARASATRERQAEVAERQRRVAERLAEREAGKSASPGLPPP